MTLKLQYDNFETGEFTEEKTVDKETFLSIFDQSTEIVKTNRSFTIKRPLIKFYIKSGENFLCIMHFAKDAFTVWYCNGPDDKLYQGNFYKKTTKKIIENFFDNNYQYLNELIPQTNKSEKELISWFVEKNFFYTYRQKGLFGLIFDTICYLSVLILFILISLKTVFYFLILPLLILTLIILLYKIHYNYIQKSKRISIKVSSGSQKVTIYLDNNKVEFEKTDIKKLVLYFAAGYRSPFSDYSYARIILNDNRVFIISYMVLDTYELGYKLSKVQTERKLSRYPYINN